MRSHPLTTHPHQGVISTSSWSSFALCLLVAACGGGDGGPPDRTAPTVSITAPANWEANLNGTIALSASTSGDANSVEFQIDGVPIAADLSAPYSTQIDTNSHASGQHVLRARAVDRVGNRSAWSTVTVQFGGARGAPAGVTRDEQYVTGLSQATAMAQTPDGRLLIAQQGGFVRVFKAGNLLPRPMLSVSVSSTGERGLLGIAVHPNFSANRWIYVYYTTPDSPPHNRISRFTVANDVIVPSSEFLLVDNLPNLGPLNHNGGALHFGADGKLYVAVGDNANSATSQNLASPLGKLLRFNDDGSIPNDNPFCTTPNTLACAVWATGLRNPFTFAIEPGSGRMLINDVGQDAWEEINLAAAGANYGWPNSEGFSNLTPNISAPLFAYQHSPTSPPGSGPGGFFTGTAIVGGAFYPASGPLPAACRGGYFFADHGSRFIACIDLNNDNATYSFGSVSAPPVGMLVANDGALLVLTLTGVVRFR